MSDPISRLEVVQREIDRAFGDGYAAAHPELVAIVMQSAASDYAAPAIARGLQSIAAALIEPEEEARIVSARELLRARP
jgi:hypothetical protein